jgi:hypothetical protein
VAGVAPAVGAVRPEFRWCRDRCRVRVPWNFIARPRYRGRICGVRAASDLLQRRGKVIIKFCAPARFVRLNLRWLVVPFVAIAAISLAPTAHAVVLVYQTAMDGPSEFPVNPSPGTGFAQVDYDNVTHMMRVRANFTGLLGTTTAAHIHAPIPLVGDPLAGVATQVPSFSGFPLGVTNGTMDTTFDLTQASSWNPTFVTANGGTPATAEAAFFSFMTAGRAYFNIHTTNTPGGEIRGFFALVPEPACAMLVACGLASFALVRRAR